MKKETIVSLGLAMFTMLFGAGNIVFPLVLGKNCGPEVWFALCGFGLTAVLLPVLGFVATVLCDGDFSHLLKYLGTIPSSIMVFLIMLLIGPLCAIPRCILLSYGTLKPLLPAIHPLLFGLIAAGIIFVCSYWPSLIVKAFGRFFGPLKLSLIGFLVIKCFFTEPAFTTAVVPHPFIEGLVAGYETMDLLAALVITGLMAVSMPWIIYVHERGALKSIIKKTTVIGLIGGGALSLVYAGFALSAARFSGVLAHVRSDEILTVLATHVMGSWGHFVATTIVLVTCLTTAVVLSAAVARYLEHLFRNSGWDYSRFLLATCLLAGVMSVVGFDGLTHAVEPIVLILYPVVILLAFAVIVLKMRLPRQKDDEGKVMSNFFGGGTHARVQERVAAVRRGATQSTQPRS